MKLERQQNSAKNLFYLSTGFSCLLFLHIAKRLTRTLEKTLVNIFEAIWFMFVLSIPVMLPFNPTNTFLIPLYL